MKQRWLQRRRYWSASMISRPSRQRTIATMKARAKVRTIFHSGLERQGDLLIYRVTGSGFLKHMVRNIVGMLLEVGKGNLNDHDVLARLLPNCGISPGPRAPASGLFLLSVEYDEDQPKTEKISET